MLRKTFFVAFAAILVALTLSSKAQAWGAYHVGYTHYSPYTGLHHYGYTEAHRGGFGAFGGVRYGSYGAARYGYYRRW